MGNKLRILGICGSLRMDSANGAILKAAQNFFLNHDWAEINLADFPYFDPDNQFSDSVPQAVEKARILASECSLLFIATPEYAHGAPGILKNGLEWLFHEGTQKKPVALVIGAAQGEHTQKQLVEILKTMDFEIALEKTLIIKGLRAKINDLGKFTNKDAELEFKSYCSQFI